MFSKKSIYNNRFNYQSSDQTGAPIVSGNIATYGRGGFVQDLATTHQSSLDLLTNLQKNFWTDRGTRAVLLDFTVYNANINLFCQTRLKFFHFYYKIIVTAFLRF
jgi:hypothetical protein